MRKSRFKDKQITCSFQQAEYRTPLAEVIRKTGISEQTFNRWKKKYCSMTSSEVHRLEQLEEDLAGEKLPADDLGANAAWWWIWVYLD